MKTKYKYVILTSTLGVVQLDKLLEEDWVPVRETPMPSCTGSDYCTTKPTALCLLKKETEVSNVCNTESKS